MKMKNKWGFRGALIRISSILLVCIMLFGVVGCRVQPQDSPVVDGDAQTQSTPPPAISDLQETPVDDYISEGSMISTADLAEALREKYADAETMVFQESLWNLPKDQEFYIDFEFDLIEDTELRSFDQVFAIYADAEMTDAISTAWEIVTHEDDPSIPEGHNRVYARPGRFTPGSVWGSYYDLVTRQLVRLDEAGEYYLHEQEPFSSWGFLKYYYLVQHLDTVTAETLERPIVTIFTVENQLDAPQSEFYVTENGEAAFRWNEVEGADYYLIVEINEDSFAMISPIDKATGTSWVYPHRDDMVATMNQKFSGSFITDDDMLDRDDDFERREASYLNYSVIAVNSEGHSPLGTIHRGEDLAARLPYVMAHNTIRQDAEETGGNILHFPSVGLIPTHRAISLANGATVHRRMIYDFDGAEIKIDRWLHYDGYDDDGELLNTRIVEHTNLHIDFVIEGTLFTRGTILTNWITIIDVNPDTIMEELESVRQMHEDTATRGGGSTETDVETAPLKEDSKTSKDAPREIPDRTEDRIFANSALSEFLALNLLAANELIDLSAFPESANWERLMDAFFEAMYQNPLVLHVERILGASGSNLLIVEYRESARTIHAQQAALRGIVPRIVSEIIIPGMTDLEKSFAINNFLIENSEYDWAALEEAERNNFQFVDARFNDSFTAYGILINGVGVCSGYADAFKLLADEAGLDAIVVTGYLEGILPHAWNRVYIDGQWHTVDVTNNANEFLMNAFLNLPDSAAGRLLVEDNQFMMNDFIAAYRSNDGSSEYYRVTDRFFSASEIAAELARAIRSNGSVTLRTYYDLDDDMFFDIAMEVMDILDVDNLYGFYILGVIWMSDSV